MYLEAGNSTQYNPQAVLKILQYMAKSGIVFGGINFQVNQCRNCKEHFHQIITTNLSALSVEVMMLP